MSAREKLTEYAASWLSDCCGSYEAAQAEAEQLAQAFRAEVLADCEVDRFRALRTENETLRATLADVLHTFVQRTHPGRAALQSRHVDVAEVERWRAVLNPPKEQS